MTRPPEAIPPRMESPAVPRLPTGTDIGTNNAILPNNGLLMTVKRGPDGALDVSSLRIPTATMANGPNRFRDDIHFMQELTECGNALERPPDDPDAYLIYRFNEHIPLPSLPAIESRPIYNAPENHYRSVDTSRYHSASYAPPSPTVTRFPGQAPAFRPFRSPHILPAFGLTAGPESLPPLNINLGPLNGTPWASTPSHHHPTTGISNELPVLSTQICHQNDGFPNFYNNNGAMNLGNLTASSAIQGTIMSNPEFANGYQGERVNGADQSMFNMLRSQGDARQSCFGSHESEQNLERLFKSPEFTMQNACATHRTHPIQGPNVSRVMSDMTQGDARSAVATSNPGEIVLVRTGTEAHFAMSSTHGLMSGEGNLDNPENVSGLQGATNYTTDNSPSNEVNPEPNSRADAEMSSME